jgi:glycerol-3-phosphate acyltransferase PlsY
MSNSVSVLGIRYAIIVLFIDVFKSFAAYLICSILFNGVGASVGESFVFGDASNGVLPGMYGSLGAILGHAFPIYMKFRGGKGMACILGLILSMDVIMTGLMLSVALLTIIITRFFSPAAIVSLVMLPISIAIFFRNHEYSTEAILIGIFICGVLMIKHRGNVRNIMNGTESRIGRKSKQPPV